MVSNTELVREGLRRPQTVSSSTISIRSSSSSRGINIDIATSFILIEGIENSRLLIIGFAYG